MEHSFAGTFWRLAGILALVLANGFFVSAEFSIVTVRKTRIEQLVAEGHRRARAVRRAVTHPDRYIAATQLGITMASLGLGWIGEPALASLIQPALAALPSRTAATTAHSIAVAAAFTLITAFQIVFGELAPKWIALERAEGVAMWVVKPCEIFMRALWPFIRVLHDVAQAVVKVLGLRVGEGRGRVHSEEELKMLVTASQEAGVLEEQEEQMLHRVFSFAEVTAAQVMVPRTEIVGIEADAPVEALLEIISRTGYARLPVYRRDVDNIVGILHVTDLVKALSPGDRTVTPAALAREALTVPKTLGADDLLAAFRRRGTHEAIVIDEYGGTAGLVTFDSLMARIVGEIGGAAGGERIAVRPDGAADIDGLALVADANEQLGLKIDKNIYTTVGGYVLGRLGRRVRVGDAFDVEGRTLRVVAVDGLRVAKVWLSKPSVSTADAAGDGDADADH